MTLFTPTASRRLNEVTGFVFLAVGVLLLLSLASFHPGDPSWNHVGGNLATRNLIGRLGAHLSDLLLQAFGLGAFVFPLLVFRARLEMDSVGSDRSARDQTHRQHVRW